MKSKSKAPEPYFVRNLDSTGVTLRTSSGATITIIRRKGGPNLLKPRWTSKDKARISWSGGNGHQTIQDAQEMGRFLEWAARIAQNLNVRNPDRVTQQDIVYTLPLFPSAK